MISAPSFLSSSTYSCLRTMLMTLMLFSLKYLEIILPTAEAAAVDTIALALASLTTSSIAIAVKGLANVHAA